MITIQWWNDTNFANTVYTRNFKHKLMLDTFLALPEVVEVVVAEANGEGVNVALFQRMSKRYSFEVVAPEFIIDALHDIRLHDNITVTDHDGVEYVVSNRNTWDVGGGVWLGMGCQKQLTVTFQTNDRVIRTNCTNDSCSDGVDCSSVCVVSGTSTYNESYWHEINISGQAIDLSIENIEIRDLSALETHLNTLGYGVFTVTENLVLDEIIISNVQGLPAQHSLISIAFEDTITANIPVFMFSTDCVF
jgi:hypothetical protein